MSNNQPKILVTGAAGHLGSLVVAELVRSLGYPVEQIIAASRNPDQLVEWAKLGVETRKADFTDVAGLAEAFRGVDRLLLISTDSPVNELRLGQHLHAVEAAKLAGVQSIVYTSMPKAEDSAVSFASVHLGTENAIKASGLTYTILRNGWYFENLAVTIPGAVSSGTLYSAAGDGGISYLSRQDLAKAAAAALVAGSEFENETLTLTGETALSYPAIAAKVSEAVGKPISVVQVPVGAIIEGAKSHGLPEVVATMIASFDAATAAGDLSVVTSDYERLTGKKPTPFGVWLEANKQLFTA